jgi:hypothetical protein
MAEASDDPRLNELRRRIEELNHKGAQLLIFLGIGIAATILLWSTDLLTTGQQDLLLRAMRWWILAILPAVIGILPLKEFRENSRRWYGAVRYLKFALLWLAIAFIVLGATYFLRCIVTAEPVDDTQSTMLRTLPGRKTLVALTQPREIAAPAQAAEFSAQDISSPPVAARLLCQPDRCRALA